MIVLDENVPEEQCRRLRRTRLAIQQIGVDLGRRGMKDDAIIPLLQELNRPTFFTLDGDFFDRRLCHDRYCLVHLDIEDDAVGDYLRRFLKQRTFNTRAKRLGSVVRVSSSGLLVWRSRKADQELIPWR